MPVGAVESVLTVTSCEAQVVVLQVPLYLTKYVVLEAGETKIEFPVPKNVPPQLPEYHWATAPVPALPPETVSVVLPPAQIVVVPVMLVGATDKVFAVNEAETQAVGLQPEPVPGLYRTK